METSGAKYKWGNKLCFVKMYKVIYKKIQNYNSYLYCASWT